MLKINNTPCHIMYCVPTFNVRLMLNFICLFRLGNSPNLIETENKPVLDEGNVSTETINHSLSLTLIKGLKHLSLTILLKKISVRLLNCASLVSIEIPSYFTFTF